MGRPSKLTDEIIRQAEELAALCLPLETIASVLAVSSRTMREWRSRGRELNEQDEDSNPTLSEHDRRCLLFLRALNKGFAASEQKVVQAMMKAAEDGAWGAGKFLLTSHPVFRKSWKEKEIKLEDAFAVIAKALEVGNEQVARMLRAAVAQAMQQPSV